MELRTDDVLGPINELFVLVVDVDSLYLRQCSLSSASLGRKSFCITCPLNFQDNTISVEPLLEFDEDFSAQEVKYIVFCLLIQQPNWQRLDGQKQQYCTDA